MTHWSATHPTARKKHLCEMCRRIIEPGEKYLRGVGLDGTAWTWKECAHCEETRIIYDLHADGEYNADYFYEWTRDAGGHDLTELRHAAGYRMKWRTRAGTLLPIPERAAA